MATCSRWMLLLLLLAIWLLCCCPCLPSPKSICLQKSTSDQCCSCNVATNCNCCYKHCKKQQQLWSGKKLEHEEASYSYNNRGGKTHIDTHAGHNRNSSRQSWEIHYKGRKNHAGLLEPPERHPGQPACCTSMQKPPKKGRAALCGPGTPYNTRCRAGPTPQP